MTQGVQGLTPDAAVDAARDRGALLGLADMPGPEPMPIVGWPGNALQYQLDRIHYIDKILAGGYGELTILARGMRGTAYPKPGSDIVGSVFAIGPTYNQRVLTHEEDFKPFGVMKLKDARGLGCFFDDMMLFNHGDKHRAQRRLLAPVFHPRRLDAYRNILAEITDRVVGSWRPGESIDVPGEARRIMIEFVGRLILGEDDITEVVSLAERMELMTARMSTPWVWIPLRFRGAPQRWLVDFSDQLADDLSRRVARRCASPRKDGDDLLSVLVRTQEEEGTKLTPAEVLSHIFLFFQANYYSTVGTLTWALYVLAQHPKVAADLHEELTSKLRGDAPTVEQFRDLPVLDGVIKETLRLFPPIYFTLRESLNPVQLGPYLIPPKTEVTVSMYHTHRLPDLYPEPRRFLPERWSSLNPSSFAYMPFGAGPHTCIGWALALVELKVMVSLMTQRFRLEMPRGARLDRSLGTVMDPKRGPRVLVRAQDRHFVKSRNEVRGHFTEMVDLRG